MAGTSGSSRAGFRGDRFIMRNGAPASFSRHPSESASGRHHASVPETMSILFLVSFIGGLLLAVRVMMYGVERPREKSPSGERSFQLSPALLVSFAVVFGVVGYI